MTNPPGAPGLDVTPNDVLAFAVEMAALVALSAWGFRTGTTRTTSWLLGLGTPLAAAAAWGLFAAPQARFDVPAVAVVTKVVVLGGALAAARTLLSTTTWVVVALVVIANTVLLYVGPWTR